MTPNPSNIICNPSLARISLGFPCKHISPRNNIEQERILLLADELIVQPVLLMNNPGSQTMGFAGVEPRHFGICVHQNKKKIHTNKTKYTVLWFRLGPGGLKET